MIMHDLSNPALAELLGIHPTHASRIRNGRRIPSIEVMRKVRETFHWSVDDQADAVAEDRYFIVFDEKIAAYLAAQKQEATA